MTDREPIAERLCARLEERSATVGVVGLGYIGLPLAGALFGAGYPARGYDIDRRKVEMLERGESYLPHLVGLGEKLATSGRFLPTDDPAVLHESDVVILCVPTPLGAHREPDLRFVLDSTRMVGAGLRRGQLVVLTSTTYPGTTRQDVLPILEETGLRCGEDFFLAYSPEREDPGRTDHSTASIPKLVGAVDPVSQRLAVKLLEGVVEHVQPVASAEIAEAAKLLENVYRAVNIALVNELKVLLDRLDIDVWEVIRAAATKPFGFQPFYPGPGLGGHCIPIDPFYLAWKAREVEMPTRFIELAGEINASMPEYVVERVVEALNESSKPMRGARVLVLGIAYKPNVSDIRETPAAPIVEGLQRRGAVVSYHDPHVERFPRMRKHSIELASVRLDAALLESQDCSVVVTDHADIDWQLVADHAPLIVDTRNIMARFPGASVWKA